MKSKISFFNRTLFRKNVTRLWPVWGVYLVILLIQLPVFLMMYCRIGTGMIGERVDLKKDQLNILYSLTSPSGYMWAIEVMAICIAILLFAYLNSLRSANSIHAMPVTRLELFSTNYLSGLLFMVIPQLITFVVTVLIALVCGITKLQYFGIWLVSVMAISAIAYNIAVFCVFLTGQSFMVVIGYYVINYGYYLFVQLPYSLVSETGYGYGYSLEVAEWTMPMQFLGEHVGYKCQINTDTDKIVNMQMKGMEYLLVYLLVTLVLLVVAFLMYKKRHMEMAGEIIAVKTVRPVFPYVVGYACGYMLASLLYMIFSTIIPNLPVWFAYLLIVSMSVVGFFFATVLLEKTFRVFNVKKAVHLAIFIALTTLSVVGLRVLVKYEEKYIPGVDEIRCAYIRSEELIEFTGDELNRVVELHKQIISNKEDYNYTLMDDTVEIEIAYRLENNKVVTRYYTIPYVDGKDIINEVQMWLHEEKHYKEYYFGVGADKVKDAKIGSVFSYQEEKYYVDIFDGDDNKDEIELTKAERVKLAEAIIKDIENGSIIEYNPIRFYWVNEGADTLSTPEFEEDPYPYLYNYDDAWFEVGLYITFDREDGVWNVEERYSDNTSQYESDEMWGDSYEEAIEDVWEECIYFDIGKDCVNTLKVLEELGIYKK